MAPTPIAQPVAQTATDLEQLWEKTLSAIRAVFPLVGVALLTRLLTCIAAVFQGVEDSELAEAVGMALRAKRGRNFGEGLLLCTVPEALGALRRRPTAEARGSDAVERLKLHIGRVIESVRTRGAPFRKHLGVLTEIASVAGREGLTEGVHQAICAEAAGLVDTALTVIPVDDLKPLETEALREVDGYLSPASHPSQRKVLFELLRGRAVLKALGIEYLSVIEC